MGFVRCGAVRCGTTAFPIRSAQAPAPTRTTFPGAPRLLRATVTMLRYRCLQNKRLTNPFPQNINVDEMNNGSGSACKINTRFRKIISVVFSTLNCWCGGEDNTMILPSRTSVYFANTCTAPYDIVLYYDMPSHDMS